jgi:hypothetical protein
MKKELILMNYIKVLAIESHFSQNDILIDFDKIIFQDGKYTVYADGEAQLSFPIKENCALRPIKSVAADEHGVTFIYYKYQED